MRVRSPRPGWLAAASVARALFVLSLLRGNPSFRLYLGWSSERLAPSHFSHFVARGAALLGRKKKERNGRPLHRNPKHALSPYLSSSLSMILAREAAIFCSIGREAKRKRKVSHRSWFLAVNEVGRHVGPSSSSAISRGVCRLRRPIQLCRFKPFTSLFLNVFGWVKNVGRTSFVFKFHFFVPFLSTR